MEKLHLLKPFVTLLLTLICAEVFADNITVQGEVAGTWQSDSVLVTGDLLVPDGELLVIQAGVEVIFTGWFELRVEGAVRASGTSDEPIRFTRADTTGFGIDTIPVGGWKGVYFDHTVPTNDSSIFNYCHFEYGKMAEADPVAGNGGGLRIRGFGKVRISHCTFSDCFARYNGGAIYLDSADVQIRHNSFLRNRAGLSVAPWGYGGAICSDHSSPEIWWNVFEANSSTGVGGGLAVRFMDCNVYNNIFSGNNSGLGGGLGVLHMEDIAHRIVNNLVSYNTAAFFGGGVASLNASPYYINNTIAFNQAMYGGGFYCKDSVSPDFYNTIIWGNTAAVGAQGYLFEVYSQANFYNCDLQGGPVEIGGSGGGTAFQGAFDYCLDADPLFLGNGEHPFGLRDDSPCIDAGAQDTTGFLLPGNDLAGNPRFSHNSIDMGPYEAIWVGVKRLSDKDDILLYPNPTNGKLTVRWGDVISSHNRLNIIILNISGKSVESIRVADGALEHQFDLSRLPAGIYVVELSTGTRIFSAKLSKTEPPGVSHLK